MLTVRMDDLDLRQFKHFAKKWAIKLRAGDCVCLYGELGSGKTTMVREIGAALNIEDQVTSPTYAIAQRYTIPGLPPITLHHLDLYRLHNEKELHNIDVGEYIRDKQAITIIEWPEIAQKYLPHKRYDIYIKVNPNETRTVIMHQPS